MTQTDSTLTAIILAAGKGTRMRSELAKVLHEACGRPLAAYVVDVARSAGAGQVAIVVGHQADAVRARLSTLFPDGLSFVLQSEQKGTGHAVLCARDAVSFGRGDVIVLSGDVPLVRRETVEAVVRARRASKAAMAIVTMTPGSPSGYGRVVKDKAGHVTRIVEERDATPDERAIGEVNAGLYCFDAAFLKSSLDLMTPQNAQGEYYLTDLVKFARAAGRDVVATSADSIEMSGVNDRSELACVESALRSRINRDHMRAGVTMRDPSTTSIDATVQVDPDVELAPQVSLHGRTRIGRGARIGQGCVIIDSIVGEGAVLRPYSHLESAVVGPECQIGPFARLRPGTELDRHVHIGNFVETKKTRMGEGSKANHLAYLGDAVIGRACNIGAGTITCNYDGVHKHETRLGDGVFIGSDTQLVAPVTLADGAYVGAGSTITKDVPADALAFTRAPQTVKEGWAAKRRARMPAKKST